MMTSELRILTVRQPYAWAIIHGGKDVENRVRNIAGGYRGAVAIHAGLRPLDEMPHEVAAAIGKWSRSAPDAQRYVAHPLGESLTDENRIPAWYGNRGAIIGVVDLRATHHAEFCADEPEPCSPWAEPGEMWHLELTNPRPLRVQIQYRGALGLRRLDEETTAAVWSQIGEQR